MNTATPVTETAMQSDRRFHNAHQMDPARNLYRKSGARGAGRRLE